jgi:D-beta-D-heptose 7-phosphate kinase/D-beta-D-heptose 1-phosphate adenosyltransferase
MSIVKKFIEVEKKSGLAKVGIVGDAMLDQYFDVSVKKISPEFPIPVMHSKDDLCKSLPGGAANVAYQFRNFSFEVDLLSYLDKEALSVLEEHNIKTKNSLEIKNKIPRKKRFYSDDYPTYRWDVEQDNYGFSESESSIISQNLYENCMQKMGEFNAVVFSDYNKGVFKKDYSELISKIPITVVDPKSGDVRKWKGCTVIKPNLQEAYALSGCKNLNEAGFKILRAAECKAVIITQSGNGVAVFTEDGMQEVKPDSQLPPAESVIGAGDCFTAFLTMALIRNFSIYESANIAWNAGILYVKNKHNKPLNSKDLIKSYDSCSSKLIDDFKDLKNRDYKLVFTNGCFDILHAGHIEVLKFAKKQGDKLIVAINSDRSVGSIKPGRPFVNQDDRVKMVSSLEFVDYVCVFDEQTPYEILNKITPDIIVKGSEYQPKNVVGFDIAKVVTCPMVEGLSTTNLINKIKSS